MAPRGDGQVDLLSSPFYSRSRRFLFFLWFFVFFVHSRQSVPLPFLRILIRNLSPVSVILRSAHDWFGHPHFVFLIDYYRRSCIIVAISFFFLFLRSDVLLFDLYSGVLPLSWLILAVKSVRGIDKKKKIHVTRVRPVKHDRDFNIYKPP